MEKERLLEISIQDIPMFRLLGTYKCIVQKIYDGDTPTIIIEIAPNKFYAFNIRLYGIDTPEVRGESREQGLVSREQLIKLTTDKDTVDDNKMFINNKKILTVFFHDIKEKYGRPISTLYFNDISINQQMIDKGYAKEYFGGKKP